MLHCPATLLVARHGDATYGHAPVLSADGGALSELGREQVRALAESLRDERVAAVVSSAMEWAVESAAVAAELLDAPRRVVAGLQEVEPGDYAGREFSDPEWHAVLASWFAGELDRRVPGGPSGSEVLERMRAALEEVADLHRGERVLVFSHGGVMSLCLPRLAHNVRSDRAHRQFLPNATPVRLEVGDDGWHLVGWPGSEDLAVV